MDTVTYKTSTILVSTGRRTRVFRSLDDMPRQLRKRISENIAGPNSRTLVVADRRGQEYLLKTLKREATSSPAVRKTRNDLYAERWNTAARYWVEIGLVGLLGLTSWALFHWN